MEKESDVEVVIAISRLGDLDLDANCDASRECGLQLIEDQLGKYAHQAPWSAQ
jgi:hypothetical protein